MANKARLKTLRTWCGRYVELHIPDGRGGYIRHASGRLTYNEEFEGFYIGDEPLEEGDKIQLSFASDGPSTLREVCLED